MTSNDYPNDTQEARKPSLMDMLLCRCASTEPQGSMGQDGKFHPNRRQNYSTKFDQLEDSVHRLCNNKKKSTSQQRFVPRTAHPLLERKDTNGNGEMDTNGKTEDPAQSYVSRAPHPILNKNETNGGKKTTPVEDEPSDSNPNTEKDQVQEETDASTQE